MKTPLRQINHAIMVFPGGWRAAMVFAMEDLQECVCAGCQAKSLCHPAVATSPLPPAAAPLWPVLRKERRRLGLHGTSALQRLSREALPFESAALCRELLGIRTRAQWPTCHVLKKKSHH